MADQNDVKKTGTSIDEHRQRNGSSYDVFILALTLISLATIVIFYVPGIPDEAKEIAFMVNTTMNWLNQMRARLEAIEQLLQELNQKISEQS